MEVGISKSDRGGEALEDSSLPAGSGAGPGWRSQGAAALVLNLALHAADRGS